MEYNFVIFLNTIFLLTNFPNQQKRISNIFICSTRESVSHCVHYFSDVIYEKHHIFLKNFCGISEISNITEPINGAFFLSRNHGIYIPRFLHILSNNFRTGISESQSQQNTNFNNRIFNNIGFQIFPFIFYKLLLFSRNGIFCNFIHFFNQSFNRS